MTLCSLPFLAQLGDFSVHSEMADLLAGDQRSLSSFEDADGQLANTLGDESVAVMISLRTNDVFAPQAISDIQSITNALMENTNFFHTFSLASPEVKPQFVVDWSQVQMVLGQRLKALGLTNNHVVNLTEFKVKLGKLVKGSLEHGPRLIEASGKVQSPNIGIVQKGLLKADILRRQAIIALDVLSLANAVQLEWDKLKHDFQIPIKPLVPVIKAYLSADDNATRKAIYDLERKANVELDEIQRALMQQPGGDVVQFGLGSIFQRSSAEMSPEERNATKHWTVNYPFFRNLIVDTTGQHAMIFAFANIPRGAREDKSAFCRDVNRRLQPFRDRGLDIRLLSFPHGEVETMTYLKTDIGRMLPAMSAVLLVVLLAAFRFSPALVCFVLLMQVIGVALALGLVPALGFRINPFTIPLFPLLTGIHLTLLIHIGTAFQAARRAGMDVELAMSAMLGQVFKACAFAALTTTVGLLALSFSEVRPTAVFGQLGACGIVAMFVLSFGPGMALLRVLGRLTVAGDPREQGSKATWPATLVDGVMRRRSMILSAAILVIVTVCFGWSRVRTDIRIVEFLNPQSETRQALEELDQAYGGVNFAKLEIDTGKTSGVRRTEFFRFINDLQVFAEKQEGVSMVYSVGSLLRAADQVLQENFWHLPSMIAPRARATMMIDQFERPEIRHQLPLLDSLYDREMRKAWLVLRTRDLPSGQYIKLLDAVEAEAKRIKPAGFNISMKGAIQQIQKADRQIVDSQRKSAMWTVGMIGILLAILWRSIGLALLALAANTIPVGLVVAVQGLSGVPLNSITIMVTAIAFGIAVDDTIHFITHWRDECRRGVSAREAVLNTLRVKGRPIVCTTIILVGIMCVFFLASFPPVVAFGWLSAIGFAGALVAALGLLPIALAGDE